MTRYLNIILIASLIMLSLNAASASSDDISNLKKLISASNDPKMSTQDLAFFLATHNYDVTPKESYVELRLDGQVYKVTPDGDKPEICDMKVQSLEG